MVLASIVAYLYINAIILFTTMSSLVHFIYENCAER